MEFFSDYFRARHNRSPFDQYAIGKYGYQNPAMGSADEFAAFDRADFDKIGVSGLQVAPELSFGEKLGLGMGQGGGMNPWAQYGMSQGQAPALKDPISQIAGLMNPALAGTGQRPYQDEVVPRAPMPDYVQQLLQRGLMG